MQFNANTNHFEYVGGTGEQGKFGFERDSREEIWMSFMDAAIQNRYVAPGPGAHKGKIQEYRTRHSAIMNRAYDFMFWIDEHNIDFYPVSQPKVEILAKVRINDSGDDQLLHLAVRTHRFPIDDAQDRMLKDTSICLALGLMEPVGFDSDTDECTAWTIEVAPIRPEDAFKQATQVIELAKRDKDRQDRINKLADNTASTDALEDVTVVNDELWALEHKSQLEVLISPGIRETLETN